MTQHPGQPWLPNCRQSADRGGPAGWSACFERAMGIAAKQQNIDLRLGDDGHALAAPLKVSLPGSIASRRRW